MDASLYCPHLVTVGHDNRGCSVRVTYNESVKFLADAIVRVTDIDIWGKLKNTEEIPKPKIIK